ncbi:MAG: RluA family pseudouridine synthase [bacterium]|nr:RluA family pseudouridine synthase [bacterium]
MRDAFIIEDADAGARLDRLLFARGYSLSRTAVQRAIAQGDICLNGKICKPGCKVKAGDVVEGDVKLPVELAARPQKIDLNIVYEDEHIIVINKQRGMVVHPAAGSVEGTLVNALLYRCPDITGVGDRIRPGIVHRLDKDTTGLMVVAKNGRAHLNLARDIQRREVKRIYLAFVYGMPEDARGIIDAPIGRHPTDRKKMSIRQDGRVASTGYRVLECHDGISLVEATLMTGRTHQIRVHMAAIGHQVVGDPVYGPRRIPSAVKSPAVRHLIEELKGQALHAFRLSFRHPATGEEMCFEAPLPPDTALLLDALRAAPDEEVEEIGF